VPLFSRKDIQFLKFCISGSQIFSTCSKRKYMSILTDDNYMVIGLGYNGGPKNYLHCDAGGCPRVTENSPNGSNYDNCISIHAEQNALLHSDHSARPTRLYVNGPPCFTCAKLIVNSTIKKVFYIRDESYSDWPKVAEFMKQNNIELLGYTDASPKN